MRQLRQMRQTPHPTQDDTLPEMRRRRDLTHGFFDLSALRQPASPSAGRSNAEMILDGG